MFESFDYGNLNRETHAVHGTHRIDTATGAISMPIFQSATFRHPELHQSTGFDYSRGLNPTRLELEDTLALLEHAKYGLAFSSGMAAISAFVKLFEPGDHIVVSSDLYGGTWRLFNDYYAKYGLRFSWVDTADLAGVRAALRAETRGLVIETPSNPLMRISDIRGLADLMHNHRSDSLVAVDNTFLSPYYQNPLDLGADFVIHSGTKYLSGHNDCLSGFLAHSSVELAERMRTIQMSEGAALGPFDAWLTLRGIKTLAVRLDRQSENARRIAEWLRRHPKVERVLYPGFADHPGHDLCQSQARGFGAMISFYLKDAAEAPRLLKNISLILFAESLGGVESLLTYPLEQTHKAIPREMREAGGVTDRLMRLSVGIEKVDDLIADLERAFG